MQHTIDHIGSKNLRADKAMRGSIPQSGTSHGDKRQAHVHLLHDGLHGGRRTRSGHSEQDATLVDEAVEHRHAGSAHHRVMPQQRAVEVAHIESGQSGIYSLCR